MIESTCPEKDLGKLLLRIALSKKEETSSFRRVGVNVIRRHLFDETNKAISEDCS